MHSLSMIEAKAIQRIRHAEIKAQKIVDDNMRESEKKIASFEKSCENRIDTETNWVRKRAEKIVEHAKKVALEERSERILLCQKKNAAMNISSSRKKGMAVKYILNEITGGG